MKQSVTKYFYLASITFFVCLINWSNLGATPEFASWTDNKCSKCHVNMQGGGMRNEFGWQFAKDASYFSSEDDAVKPFYSAIDKSKYNLLPNFALGFDFRLHTVRSHKTEDAVRRLFPMQGTLYAAFTPASWFALEGQANATKVDFFPGQQWWHASAIIKSEATGLSFRFGKFQPSMGLRDCDMTSFDRRVAMPDGTESFIPPDYSEFGAEIIVEPADWITLNAGIFDTRALDQLQIFGMVPLVNLKGNSIENVRAILYPHMLLDFLPEMYIGASHALDGDFTYSTVFGGYTPFQELNIYGKYIASRRPYARETDNFVVGASYMPLKGIILGARAEFGSTDLIIADDSSYVNKDGDIIHVKNVLDVLGFHATQIVLNAKVFVMPYVELIPEYRFLRCKEYESTRWVLQLHMYY